MHKFQKEALSGYKGLLSWPEKPQRVINPPIKLSLSCAYMYVVGYILYDG
jgi:hypothetical protein